MNKTYRKLKMIQLSVVFLLCATASMAQQPFAGADEKTPAKSEYFSWINHTNEGPTAEQTRINLDFFRWLHDRYGMKLDIYAFDAGTIDGAKIYGSTSSSRFKQLFPHGFSPLVRQAAEMDTRFGVWGGPDGFGNSPDESKRRMDMMVSLVKDYHFQLFKMDAVCGQLRPEKYDDFNRMMTEIRKISPDFILLNHRLMLGKGSKHSTTFLLGGAETYIDVHMTNDVTAPHHRAKSISRKAPENLTRLTEDHGVCLSSCLDGWDDDLILQAFNRNLILAPQIYANPWLLRDDELAYLAFIYNLHRKYRDILVDGKSLPESKYGLGAISRGNGKTQFITLRNLSWYPVKYKIRLDEEIGLNISKQVKVRLYHPYIYDLGTHNYASAVEVEVLPFRTVLVKFSTEHERDKSETGRKPSRIIGDKAVALENLKPVGEWHYKVSSMKECDVPEDAASLYYATCFAADNNALEVRSLVRSGDTKIPQVQAARDAFFNQPLFKAREIWDRYLFDNDLQSAYSISMRWGDPRTDGESEFCLDMGVEQLLDSVVLESFDEYSIAPLKSYEGVQAYVSNDLHSWKEITFMAGSRMEIDMRAVGPFRFLRFAPCPLRLSEVSGYKNGAKVNRLTWRASNLFRSYGSRTCHATQAWESSFRIDKVQEGGLLCVAVNGYHGKEGAWVGFKIEGKYVGCPDRAPSFASNTWEYKSGNSDKNYTYYLPLHPDMAGKLIEAYVIVLDKNENYMNTDRPEHEFEAMKKNKKELNPEVWVTSRSPFRVPTSHN